MTDKKVMLTKCMFLLVTVWFGFGPSGAAEPAGSYQPEGNAGEVITVHDGRLTIHADNVELTQLLKMLSVKRRVSIVAGPEVTGTVSLNLYDVEFHEALRSILDVFGYTATYKDGIILVTETAEQARLLLGVADMRVELFKLYYVDPDEAFTLIEPLISEAGKIVVSTLESTLLVEDSPPYLDRISSVIDQLDVPPRQVLIEARLLELDYTEDLAVGIQIGGGVVNGETIFRALTSGFAADFTALQQGSQGFFTGIVSEDVSGFLEMLAETVDVKMLANPKILALDKEQAEIIIGEKLGFRITTTTQTSSLESVEFLDVGTQLTLTPRIGDDGLILLEIHPEVSSGSISEAGLPSETTAEVTTFMLVKDGETVVLGGLLKETVTERVVKIPLLGDIPYLGHLFRRTTVNKDRSELIVLITPHIVGPEPDEAMQQAIRNAKRSSGEVGRLVAGERQVFRE